MSRHEHVLWFGRPKVSMGHRHDFDKQKARFVVLTTESLLIYPEDAPSNAIQQAIKTQQPPESRVPPLHQASIRSIRGFTYLGDSAVHVASSEDMAMATACRGKFVILLDETSGNAASQVLPSSGVPTSSTPTTLSGPSFATSDSGAKHNHAMLTVIWLSLPESMEHAIFATCLSQMVRKCTIITRGVLQKKAAVLIWKKRVYVLLDSQDLLQFGGSSVVDTIINCHIPLWHTPYVTWSKLSSTDVPSGCAGYVIRVNEPHNTDTTSIIPTSPTSSNTPIPSFSMKPVQIACEREDVGVWNKIWDAEFTAIHTHPIHDQVEVAQISALSVLRSVLSANRSRYRILIRSDRLTEAVCFGIPDELRPALWNVLCNVDGRKSVKATSSSSTTLTPTGTASPTSQYNRLVRKGFATGSLFQLAMQVDQAKHVDTIDKDSAASVGRMLVALHTYTKSNQSKPTLTPFGKPSSSLSHTSRGSGDDMQYHPALRVIATALLTLLGEEEGFWTLTWMCDRLLPQYFTTPHCIGLQIYSCVFSELMAHCLPKLAAHMTAMGLLPREFGIRWLPHCFAALEPHVLVRLWDLSILNSHAMLFRLSLAMLRCVETEMREDKQHTEHTDIPSNDASDAHTATVYDKVVSMLKCVSVEEVIGEAFHNPVLQDVERDFTTKRDMLCVQALKEVDGLVKVCHSRRDAVDCVKQTVEEFKDVLSRLFNQLPDVAYSRERFTDFGSALLAADTAMTIRDPTPAAHRIRYHIDHIRDTLMMLDVLCSQQNNYIAVRCDAMQRVIQVVITISKAAMITQSHIEEINAATVVSALSGDGTHDDNSGVGMTTAQQQGDGSVSTSTIKPRSLSLSLGGDEGLAVDFSWLQQATMTFTDSDVQLDDSPTMLLDAMVGLVYALTSFGFALVSVCKEVDDVVGTFSLTPSNTTPLCQLSKQCLSAVTDVHDFAFKLCGLVLSVRDSHLLHRFEARPILPVLTPSQALTSFQSRADHYTSEVVSVQCVVDRLGKEIRTQ